MSVMSELEPLAVFKTDIRRHVNAFLRESAPKIEAIEREVARLANTARMIENYVAGQALLSCFDGPWTMVRIRDDRAPDASAIFRAPSLHRMRLDFDRRTL